ncbi:unnamed protein product [Calypogeia fissa]
MTSVENSFQNMSENAFGAAAGPSVTPTTAGAEPPTPAGLVEAFLELEEGSSSESDEEFLEFQFRIADANANRLQEREASEHMEDWRASFASLQLKQAHEVAEFALARRREDELRIERQAKEITELRRSLEACRMEAEQAKANCASITGEKLRLEDALVDQVQMCQKLRENLSELSKNQDRLAGENLELKHTLDEAVVTTGRLKYCLEEKAAELVAWLGLDGVVSSGLTAQSSEDEFSPRTEEKKAYSIPGDSPLMSEDGQELENLFIEEELFEGILAKNPKEDRVLTSATEGLGLEEEFGDMKQEVRLGTSKHSKVHNLKDAEISGGEKVTESHNSKKKQAVATLRQKIAELQLELERLQSEDSPDEQQVQNEGTERRDIKKNLAQTPEFRDSDDQHIIECRLSDASSSSRDPEGAEGTEPRTSTASSSAETCNEAGGPDDQFSGERKPDSGILDEELGGSNVNAGEPPPTDLQMTEIQFSESFASLEQDEGVPGDSQNGLEDKFICVNGNQPWSIEIVAKLVESITEELTKLLRVVTKTPSPSNETTFTELETRVTAWSNVTSKTLQSKVSEKGSLAQWKDLVVDFLGQSRQELMSVQQRFCDCESELGLVDKLQAEGLIATQTINSLEDEIQRLEAQSFSDQIEREEEVNLLKEELEQALKETALEQRTVISLKDQLRKSEIELEKLGWAAEQEFINSCFGDGGEEQDKDDRMMRREEVGRMEKKLEDLMIRLEENERELGELLIISGVDSDAVVSAKIRRLEQKLEDARVAEEVLVAEKKALLLEVDTLKDRLMEVECELEIQSQQHVDMLVRYEEEQGYLEASETGMVHAKLIQVEQLLAEKTRQLELVQGGQDPSASQTQLLTLRARVLTLESNLAVTRQKAVDCETTIKSQLNKEKEKNSVLESRILALQSEVATLKTQFSETEQRERRAQINVDKLVVELGIAKEEVLRYEVRLQKTERQAKEDLEMEKRKHEETVGNQKQIEWHLCRQLELTEGLEKEKAKLREVLEEFELQNLALQKESDNLRTAYMQLARQAEQRGR